MTMFMKAIALFAIVALTAAESSDKTITQVIKLLQNMLKTSVQEGEEERDIFGKFKCTCVTAEKDDTVATAHFGETIPLLGTNIARLMAETGGLAGEVADLTSKLSDNADEERAAQEFSADNTHNFKAKKEDLERGISQMKDAITTLAAVGADQTKSTGADNKQFMSDFNATKVGARGPDPNAFLGHKESAVSLLNLQSQVHTALRAALALMQEGPHLEATTAYLQAPFTGTYTSQSAQVMGIIKSMRDTFEANLMDAIASEKEQIKSTTELL